MVRWSAFVAALGASACNPPINTPGAFDLEVTIPASYAVASAGQQFSMALVEEVSGVAQAREPGLVQSSGEGTVLFADLMEEDLSYEVHFWIDSNDGGGTAGICDGQPDFFDHQFLYLFGTATEDSAFTLPDNSTTYTDVCGTTTG